jgi:C-terminal processing protease CtpA/Prc
MEQHLYDPGLTQTQAYRATEARVAALARTAPTREAFVAGFNDIWAEGPFSHVRLGAARANAAETAAFLDTMRVGEGARLAWEGDVAILTVTTMMGVDTIEQIEAAYTEIAARGAQALIIDLRDNEGGAFAVRPLVAHVLAAPLDAGAFVSRVWAAEMDRAPTRADVRDVPPWEGWSLVGFWRDVESARVTWLRFEPAAPAYEGPVYVLVGPRTASAAELAADAFAASGRAVLVGGRTAGRMLSQKPYDLPEGLQVFLPIADYYAFHSGRIEGAGIAPHVVADDAMVEALTLARRRQR